MALGDPYIDTDDLNEYLGIKGAKPTVLLEQAIAAASAWINDHCGRDFNQHTADGVAVASARVYEPSSFGRVDVDDFWTTTGLIVATDTGDTGTYSSTWSGTDYTLKPFNGIESGVAGFPYRQIVAVESRDFLCRTGRARVQVTAKWGWAAVPDKVKQATRILASELFRLKDAPLGVAGVNEFGPIRVREVPQVALLLNNLQHPRRTGPLVA